MALKLLHDKKRQLRQQEEARGARMRTCALEGVGERAFERQAAARVSQLKRKKGLSLWKALFSNKMACSLP